MNDTQRVLAKALQEVKTVDPHCHLRVHKPSADTLADILLYHHLWIELVSSGMGQQEVSRAGLPQELADPRIPPLERVRRSLPYLPNIASTTVGLFLKWILQDLYGEEGLTAANFERVYARVEARGKDPAWNEELLRDRCGIEASISVEVQGAPYSPKLSKGRELYVTNLVSGKQSPAEILAGWQEAFGREIADAQDYVAFLQSTVDALPIEEYRFIGLWVLPHLAGDDVREERITGILRKARDRQPLEPAETGTFCTFGLVHLLESLRRTPLRLIQLIAGAEVLPPHRSITRWDGAFSGAIGRLADRFADFHFNLSTASDLFTQDLGILAKHIPNISVAGYWWHTLYPFYLRKSIETRLDMVPLNKIIAFFSDAYHAEWCYPKLRLVKQVVQQVLGERIERGWYDLDTALKVVEHLFHQNPMRIYRVSA